MPFTYVSPHGSGHASGHYGDRQKQLVQKMFSTFHKLKPKQRRDGLEFHIEDVQQVATLSWTWLYLRQGRALRMDLVNGGICPFDMILFSSRNCDTINTFPTKTPGCTMQVYAKRTSTTAEEESNGVQGESLC